MESLKFAAADSAGCLEYLDTATEALSFYPVEGKTSLYTFGSMMSQGELRGQYRVSYPPLEFSHKMEPSPFKMAACENKIDAASGFP